MNKALAVLAFICATAASSSAICQAPENDAEHNTRREQEFATFNPRFKELKAERIALLQTLNAAVEQREAALQSTSCSHQILWELKLMIYLTADSTAIDRRIRDLRSSLDHPEREVSADVQNPEDGSFGSCYESWPLKLAASYDHRGDKAARPFRFLDRVNSPEKLTRYLTSIATSDIARTGVDHTFDLNESLSDLMRLILRGQPKDYPWDPKLKQTLMELLLHNLRNPDTGWWGESYVRDGRIKFVDDLSMTFHTVSFLDGKVPDLPKIVDTALALKSLNLPAGWLWDGAYWNHTNMDVAVLFAYGWPYASAVQRQAMRAELEKMLRWCFAESLQPDGSFKPILPDGSLEETQYFGAAFLARTGYFDRTRRFWTDAEFPDADSIRKRIIDHINKNRKTGGAGGAYYSSILDELR
jgi:hypothetical protein